MAYKLISEASAKIGNIFLALLRNRTNLRLTREEFRFSRISFSQFGEDLAVLRWLDQNLTDVAPIYVDAGCFHPIHFSNTLLLFKRGWRGVNIDMDPERIEIFKTLRPCDLNVCAALSDAPRSMMRLAYERGLTDRINKSEAAKSLLGERPVAATRVITTTLDQVIADSGWQIDRIGYLNIDCEGHDLAVLKGLSLARYQPAIITVEAHEEHERAATVQFLAGSGYVHKEILYRTHLFVRDTARGM
jgi:FkbM family methyltransferase